MSDTYTYSELANQYGNFTVPSVKILSDGTDLSSSLSVVLANINISLSIENAGSITFNVEGAYDRKNRCFQEQVKSGFSLGKVIEAEIGYLSQRLKVFKGFITSVTVDFNENPTFRVTAMDARKLMMDACRREKYYDKPNYSDIVSEIMGDYDKLCTLTTDSTNDNLKDSVKQEESDYSFLMKLAEITDKEFFVVGSQAYFRKPKENTAAVITLEYGLSLLSFRRQSNYLNTEIVANSYNKSEQTAIQSAVTVKNEDEQNDVLGQPQKIILVQEDTETEEELKVRAESEARKRKDKSNGASGSCIGMPGLVPGRFIKLDKLDEAFNQKYYVTEVKHSIGSDGFTTEFEIEGWE